MAASNPQGQPLFGGCFGCGTDNSIGLKLRFTHQSDRVVSHTVLGREYAGYEDFVHGGVVATMLDEAMGWAMLHIHKRMAVTRGLNITYRRPVYVGRELTISARPVSVDGTKVRLEASLADERGRLLASAVGDWVTVRDERGAAKPRHNV